MINIKKFDSIEKKNPFIFDNVGNYDNIST